MTPWRRPLRRAISAIVGTIGIVSLSAAFGMSTAWADTSTPITIPSEDVFLMPSGQTLDVVERVQIKNTAQAAQDVSIPFPSGATSASVSNVPKQNVTVQGKVVHVEVAPGQQTPVVTFQMSIAAMTSVQITVHTDDPVDLVHIYVPIGNVALSAPGLMPDSQTTTVAGTDFRVFTHGSLAGSSDYTMSLSMLPTVTSSSAGQGLPIIGTSTTGQANTWQAIGNLALAALILAVALIGIRTSLNRGSVRGREDADSALEQSWEDLEMAYAAGRLDVVEYERRRTLLRDQIARRRLRNQAVSR